jgi:arginine N-succinyltransferase
MSHPNRMTPLPTLSIEPANLADLADLAELAAGMLPQPHPAPRLHLHDDDCLLVARRATGGPVLASLRIRPKLGLREPRYAYHVGCAVHTAEDLGLFQRQATLTLGNDLTGACELSDFLWVQDHAHPASAQQLLIGLIDAALDHIAADATSFGTEVVCELAGPRDESGESPFWRGLGRHFCRQDVDQLQADWGEAWHRHLAALLPKHAIYASFLPDDTQAVMGQAAADLAVLRQALAACGFTFSRHVRINDGGPIFIAETQQRRALLAR